MPTIDPPVAWAFDADVVDLTGQPLPPTADFNVPPPPEIGKVVAAWTPARTDKPTKSLWFKLLMPVAFFTALYFLGGAIIDRSVPARHDREAANALLLSLLAAVALVTLWFVFKGRQKYIWYVAEGGMARARVGRPAAAMTVLRFADAADLRVGQTRQYVNGIYAGTSYSYLWYGPDASTLLKLKGSYYGAKRVMRGNNAYRFCVVGEAMWNAHYLERASEELTRTGSLTFAVNRNDAVRISPERLEFFMRGEEVAIEKGDIAGITLNSGTFTVRHRDAKWYKRGGKYSFNYSAMSNAQVFLIALEKLLGYHFE